MDLKYLHVNEKQYSEALLISEKQVYILKKLLKDLLQNEVLIINTTLGLEIYYESPNDYTGIIKNILALIVSEKRDMNASFDFLYLKNEKEIQYSIHDSIKHIENDSFFLGYLKDMMRQLKPQYESSKRIIGKLSDLWNEATKNLSVKNVNLQEIHALQIDFQDVYINMIEDKVLKELVVGAVDVKYAN
ncbi:hypothetical protein C8N46_101592 [Kordia periserrulae]|uniref:Uncharacterized protein n=1 Tax=Kordia periserrulae TaxID=701523 RepID=A0A2T6C6P5_9FLAO|nr:hypothetical protein [Kordia periserrulae]PTX63982.1 hypothetical protein C8N46_101592 [Kordia periserrulae]